MIVSANFRQFRVVPRINNFAGFRNAGTSPGSRDFIGRGSRGV